MIETKMNKYNFTFSIIVNNRENILMDIVNLLANHKINITSLNSSEVKRGGMKFIKIRIGIEINNKAEYNYLINNITKIKDVISIER